MGEMRTFTEIINLAEQNQWCVRPNCTTCGSHEFREELKKLTGENGAGIADALCATSVGALQNLTNWDDAVHVALGEIDESRDMDRVLKSWLPTLQSNIELAIQLDGSWIGGWIWGLHFKSNPKSNHKSKPQRPMQLGWGLD